MNNFRLSEEQLEYQSLARDFAQREMAKHAHDMDKKADYPHAILDKAWQQGLVNVMLPESFGGLGLNIIEACVIAEELAFGCSGIYGPIETSTIAQMFLLDHADEALQKKFLGSMQDKFEVAGISLNLLCNRKENSCSSDNSSLTATRSGDNFTLSGRAVLSNAAHANWLVALAKSKDDSTQMYMVIIDTPRELPAGESLNILGRKAMDLREVDLSGVTVPASNVVAFSCSDAWSATVAKAHCLLASGAIGLARSGMENAIQYSKERRTFGVPIGNHQAIGFMLADMAKDIQAARLLLLHATEMIVSGQIDIVSALVAHTYAQETAAKVATDAVQVYGGYGYSREYPVEKLMRDAKVYQLFLGNAHTAKHRIGAEVLASV